jgi:hypothetical protein
LPEKAKLDSKYFRKNIIKELNLIVYTAGRKSHAIRICLHFNNCLIHNMRTVAQTMAKCDFRRLDYPAYSPDLALCDFFVSSYLHKKIARSVYETVEEVEEKIWVIIQAIPKSRLIAIFREL